MLGLWAGDAAEESAKLWFAVVADLATGPLPTRFFLVCDGLTPYPTWSAMSGRPPLWWPCPIQLIRNSLRYRPRQHGDAPRRDLKTIYTTPTAEAAFEQLNARWGGRFPGADPDRAVLLEPVHPVPGQRHRHRRVLVINNAIESLNARCRREINARGHFPGEQTALTCLYLVTRSLHPKGTGHTRWDVRCKPAVDTLAVTFADRMPLDDPGSMGSCQCVSTSS